MNPSEVINRLMRLLLPGIISIRLRIFPGRVDGEAGESYFLVCADSRVADKTTIQLYLAEYESIKPVFPTHGTDVSEAVLLAELTAAYSYKPKVVGGACLK